MEAFNQYLDTEIKEIGDFKNLDPLWLEKKIIDLPTLLADVDIEFAFHHIQEYKMLLFVRDYQKKQLNKLLKLHELFIMKSQLSMLCKNTKDYGIPFKTIMMKTLPKLVDEQYYDEHSPRNNYPITPFYGVYSTDEDDWDDENLYYIKIDVCIYIQDTMVDNIEYGWKSVMEDKFHMDEYIKTYTDSFPDTDYKNIIENMFL